MQRVYLTETVEVSEHEDRVFSLCHVPEMLQKVHAYAFTSSEVRGVTGKSWAEMPMRDSMRDGVRCSG